MRLEAIVKVNILLFGQGKSYFGPGKIREKPGNFKVDLLCKPCVELMMLADNRKATLQAIHTDTVLLSTHNSMLVWRCPSIL